MMTVMEAGHLLATLLVLSSCRVQGEEYDWDSGWTAKEFPDIRGSSWRQCSPFIFSQKDSLLYCDPDHVLNRTTAITLNDRLQQLVSKTPCHCQRKSQCVTETKNGTKKFIGFIVSVAFAKNLQFSTHDPSEKERIENAEKFARAIRGRWALGDCGNAAIVFVWVRQKKIVISTGRVTEKYLTERESAVIIEQVQNFVSRGAFGPALMILLDNMEKELRGDPEQRVDAGTLSLIISVAVAGVLVLIITGCVCAFRCCGNLHPVLETPVGRAIERVDGLKAEVIRRGSELRRSFSRSPKFPHHPPPEPLETDNPQIIFGYYKPYEGTSLV